MNRCAPRLLRPRLWLSAMVVVVAVPAMGPGEALARGGHGRGRGASCEPWSHQRDPTFVAMYQGCLLSQDGIITTLVASFVTLGSGLGLALTRTVPGCAHGRCPLARDLAITGLAGGGAVTLAGVTMIIVGQLRMRAALRALRGLPVIPALAPAPAGSWGGGLRFDF
jgi:hypothetical protein